LGTRGIDMLRLNDRFANFLTTHLCANPV